MYGSIISNQLCGKEPYIIEKYSDESANQNSIANSYKPKKLYDRKRKGNTYF